MDDKPTAHYTIYLVKDGIVANDKIIDESSASKHHQINIPNLGLAELYIKRGVRQPPKWSSLFKDFLNIGAEIGQVNGVSAALLIQYGARRFILTFGQSGRFLVNQDSIESRFGLITTLNSVAPESLRCIDKQSLDNLESQSRIQSSYGTSSDQFGIDVEQDMLKAVVGSPQQSVLGSRMTGSDALSISVKATLEDLGPILAICGTKFEEDLSAKGFEWVNNIAAVKHDSALIETLDANLEQKLQQQKVDRIWLSIPEIIDWEQVKGFTFTGGKNVIHPDITLPAFMTTVKPQDITLDLLQKRKVYCSDEDYHRVYNSWSIYRCLYAEIEKAGATFILNDGKWFRIEPDFVKKTNADFETIPLSSIALPDYKHSGEGAYNQDVAEKQAGTYALMDDTNRVFHGGGHGQVEVCDLFSKNKELIHIKRYGKSSVLSHLFAQGFVSGQLIQLDADFRSKFKAKLPKAFQPLIDVDSRPVEQELTIVFGIISDDDAQSLHLPFFSRVNANNIYRTLTGYGYTVQLKKIHVDKTFAVTQLCPPAK